jgi:hypothetical protein
MLFYALGFNVIRVLEIGRLEVQTWTSRHQIYHYLD